MSILLEALRKSEHQRRLGRAPGLDDGDAAAAPVTDMAQQWLPLTLMALSAVAMAWIGWEQFRMPPGIESGVAAAPAAGQAVTAPADVADESRVPQDDRSEAAPAIIKPSFEPAANGPRTPVEDFSRRDGSLRDVTVMPPPQDVAVAESPATDSEPEDLTDAVAMPPESRPRASRRPPAEAAPAEVGGPISFWELPQGVRDSLPDLRITVLVYADEPADRFVLIGGQRLRENETVQEGVRLEEIRREGAVFSYRTYRFLVKG